MEQEARFDHLSYFKPKIEEVKLANLNDIPMEEIACGESHQTRSFIWQKKDLDLLWQQPLR